MFKIIYTYILFLLPFIVFSQESEKLTIESIEWPAINSNIENVQPDTIVSDSIETLITASDTLLVDTLATDTVIKPLYRSTNRI
ncbi:MAG: hypothetical protein IPF54_22205 [Draconibacterium sp.]|nr:hypothetical protein [Draconibacterium sp.]